MLSAIVITKNEQDRIRTCLESIKWVDEIIIIDNDSTDKTQEIGKQFTDKIFTLKGEDFSILRNKGLDKATGEWVLFVDSDERVLSPLKEEIKTLISSTDKSAFALSRRNIIFGKEVRNGPFWPDWVIRLLKKEDFETWIGKVHEYPKFRGKLGYSKNYLLHLTHRDLDQIVLKSLEWSKIDAKLRLDIDHPRMSGIRFLKLLLAELFHQGIIRKGFFNGTVGVMDAVLQTFSLFMTYIRLWEYQQPQSLQERYELIDKNLLKNSFQYP